MKKLFSFGLLVVLSVCFITIVSASTVSQTLTLTTSNQAQVVRNNTGSRYFTNIYAPSTTNDPLVKTAVQRQALGIWGFASTYGAQFWGSGTVTFEWGGLGTLNTRATWTTNTSGGKVNNGTFKLWQ